MELIEGTHYTREGWRPGEEATLDNRPVLRYELETWNAQPDKRAFNAAWSDLLYAVSDAYEDALTDDQKALRSQRFEAQMLAEAQAFYASRRPGDNRSFWD